MECAEGGKSCRLGGCAAAVASNVSGRWDDGARTQTRTWEFCLKLGATAMRRDHRELSFIRSLIRGGTEGARAPPPFSRRAAAAADTLFKSLAARKAVAAAPC